jgi:hypothetical protein
MKHKPKYDMQVVEHYDIRYCTDGALLFEKFYVKWFSGVVSNVEYNAFLDHRRTCPDCKEEIRQ